MFICTRRQISVPFDTLYDGTVGAGVTVVFGGEVLVDVGVVVVDFVVFCESINKGTSDNSKTTEVVMSAEKVWTAARFLKYGMLVQGHGVVWRQ